MPPEDTIPGVYVQELPSGFRPVLPAPTSVAAFIGDAHRGPVDSAIHIGSMKAFERTFGRGGALYAALHLFFANGGERACVVRSRNGELKAFLKALQSLEERPFNLLCLAAGAGPDQIAFAVQACERQRAVLLLDPPVSWTDPQTALDSIGGLGARSANAAVYYPRLEGRGGGVLPPSPAVAGTIARTDARRGVWKAPAGLEAGLFGVQGVETDLTVQEKSTLAAACINPLVAGSGAEPMIWGARTLAEEGSEWRYLPVRRTALFIETSIHNSTGWVVFEPNDEPLWAQLRAGVEAFLHGLFRQGAFQGISPDEAYFVRCDASTNTTADIAARRVNLLLGFAPLRPAEFIILRIQLQTA